VGRARRHVFVCIQSRPQGGRPACGGRGGPELLAALREAVAGRPGLWDVAVTGCECLGPCFDGPNAVVYPDGVWYAGATPEDVPAIVEEHLAGGRPVARLVYAFGGDDDEAAADGDTDAGAETGED
jgi:(2Fe-2S) ferredoxin